MAQDLPQHIQLAAESAAGALAEFFDLADITIGGGTVEVRDVYDLAFAVRFAPKAFAQAKRFLVPT